MGLLLLTLFIPAFAANDLLTEPNWWDMSVRLLGGLALFLFGMEQMAGSLKLVAGERMKVVLARLTTNRFMGALTGAFVTAIIQSSSVTTVLVVGFISAGLMSMAQSIGVIMGANIGTTITAQIIAFKVSKYALLMVAFGFGAWFFSKQDKIRHYGNMLLGLGLIFFGMSLMSDAMFPLRSYQPFLDLMATMANPLIGILIAAVFTALIQSSSATTGIVIVMASQGFITLPAGIALAFGANIGTCVTAMLASIGKKREAIRAALVHVIFNIAGVLLWVAFIDYLADLVLLISPTSNELTGTAKLAADTPRQIANAHTIFNIANTLIFIGFIGAFGRLVERLVPDRPLEEERITRPRFLDDELLETPTLALDMARLEIGRAGQQVREMLNQIMPALLDGDRKLLADIGEMDDKVDVLHEHIVSYLGKLSGEILNQKQTETVLNLMSTINNLENLADLIETDLVGLGYKRLEENLQISPETQRMLNHLHTQVSQAVELALQAVKLQDTNRADQVTGMKTTVQQLFDAATNHQATRLVADEPNRLQAYTLEVEIIEKLRRIYYFAKRIAKLVEESAADPLIVETE
ncbi:MAG: Na/Pi cotransporter family protein [gamma proteobacterium endosymbiont of Lamellibrachia anaximandri]|nr:Na/Pi cotransporter family protein [gamma proteobacterium endosymbiont of Lamellibrachia anaximandri]MBL3617384.1 Na/Pi cotransporter family protein [gamma proteobacterium endosymbiont of Lamellibrachia anaximandri]